MRADRNQRVYALIVADHPYPMLFQHTGTYLSSLIVFRFACGKLLWFVQNSGEEKSQRT